MILIIDNYDSFTYNLYQIVAQMTDTVNVVRHDKISIDEIKALQPSGIILSPGPGRPEDAGICIELIRYFSESIPILGVCLGHQAIAVALGGEVVHSNDIVHGKSSLIFHNRNRLFKNLSLPFEAGRYHSLIVARDTLPESLSIDAENSEGLIMAMSHKTHPTFGVQFHPESILTAEGKKLLSNFLEICQHERATS